MARPIDILLGINPNTGLNASALVADQNFPSPVKVEPLNSIMGNQNFNQGVNMRSGDPIQVRPMMNVGSLPAPRLTPSTDTSLMGGSRTPQSGLLGTSFNDPRSVGNFALASNLLQQSGYSTTPRTTGQIIGSGLDAYTKGTMAQEDRLAKRQMSGLKNQLDMANYLNKLQEMQLGIQKQKKDDLKTKFTQEKDLRKEFTALAKPFRETITNFNKAYAFASKKNPTGASDIALVFSYMKALDPRSVVRENEQATTENAGGVPAYVRNAWNKISTGQRFDPQVRKDILDASKSLVLGQIQNQKDLEQEYVGYAQRNNLDQRNVFTSLLPKVGTYLNPLPVASMQEAEEKLNDGQFFIMNGQIGVIE